MSNDAIVQLLYSRPLTPTYKNQANFRTKKPSIFVSMGVLEKTLSAIRQRAQASKTLLSALKSGHNEGSRATPARSSRNDAQVGGRLDWGAKFTRNGQQYQNVNFQLNKGAEDSSIKDLVKKHGTHRKYAEVAVLISDPEVPTEKVKDGKKVKLSDKEIATLEEMELKNRREKMFDDLHDAL